jgi:hypothetical protein
MKETLTSDEICKELSSELRDMARWLSGGGLSPEQFRLGLSRLEDRKLKRFGLKISSSVSKNMIVHFTLRFAATEEFCSSMNVDSRTGKITTQHACV